MSLCLSSALGEGREAAPLPAPPRGSVVLMLMLLVVSHSWRPRCRVTMGCQLLPLGAEVGLRVVLAEDEGAALVVLEAEFAGLERALGGGRHGVDVALLPSDLRVVDLVEGAGQGACGASVLRDLRHVAVHHANRGQILVVELAIGHGREGEVVGEGHLDLHGELRGITSTGS